MKPRSAKAKGRRFQQEIAELIRKVFNLPEQDVRPAIMGESGTDIKLSLAALSKFPYATECKNVERINVWDAIAQGEAHASKDLSQAVVFFRRNRSKAYAIVDAEHFMELVKTAYDHAEGS